MKNPIVNAEDEICFDGRNYLVSYTYKRTDPFKLNPNLNGHGYYHCIFSQDKHAWRCLASYCEHHGIPCVGQKIYVDRLIASSLEITGVVNDYVYTPSSELEEKCRKAHDDVIAKIKARKK
tara:strand:- start:486 stop:848 length:363 start_codon:yes stop_codon:yes gene_type:complete